MAVTIDVPVWLGVMVAMLAVVSSLGAAWAVARSAATKANVELLTTINGELRADNESLRAQNQQIERERLEDKAECDRQIAEVRGELSALQTSLTAQIGEQIGLLVADRVLDRIVAAAQREG